MATGPYGNRAIWQQGHRATGPYGNVGRWQAVHGGPSGGVHLQDVFARAQCCHDQGAGGLQQGQGVMGLQGPTHLAGQAEGHQLRNRQHLHCRAKGVPAPSPARHCLARDSSFFVHCLFTFLLLICLFVPFAFHEYKVMFHTPSILLLS